MGEKVRNCEECGKNFVARRRTARFCSDACRNGRQRRAKRKSKEERECVICGESFLAAGGAKKRTCSAQCSKELVRENMRRHRQREREDMEKVGLGLTLEQKRWILRPFVLKPEKGNGYY